jgi:[ribosomal protein S18]-alanine N-acetyltransferase
MVAVTYRVIVEPMRDADVPAVAAIERRCYPVPWHENAYHTEIANRSACYLVARQAGVIVGFAGMWVVMDEAHITTLAVDKPCRRQHIGERLMLSLVEEAVYRQATRASLEVREHNDAAQRLYTKYGFRRAALRKRYYSDNQENAVVMWVDELQEPAYWRKLDDLRAALPDAG